MSEVYSQTIFLTSDESANGLSFAPTYNIPPTFIQAGTNQRIRLELNSFTIDRACWYNIHQNCSVYFIKVTELGVDYYTWARLSNGNRVPDDGSSNDIKGRFVNAFNTRTTAEGAPFNLWSLTASSHGKISRHYSFTPAYTGADPAAALEIIMLNLANPKSIADLPLALQSAIVAGNKQLYANNNAESDVSFQDTYKIFGCRPTTQPDILLPAFDVSGGDFVSPFPSKEETNQNLYVRLDQPNDNIQSEGHNPVSKENPSNMEVSNIIGKIPIPRWLPYDQTPTCPLITADADTSQFAMNLYTTNVPNFQVRITDAEGRRFPFAGYSNFSGLFKFFQFEMSLRLVLCEDRIETIKRQLVFQSEALEKIAELDTTMNLAQQAELKLKLLGQ